MKKVLVVVGLLVAGAVVWSVYGSLMRNAAAGVLRDTATQIDAP